MRGRAAAVALAIAGLCSAGAQAQVQMQLSVEPERGLPGIPSSLRVIVRNTGSTAISVPSNVALRVTAGDRPPFYAVQGPRGVSREIDLPVLDRHPEVAPGQSIDVTMWASGEHSPTWFIADSRLTKPGTYRIQLVCGITLDEDHRPHRAEPFVTSNEVTYTVVEPSGVDALAWNHIRSVGSPWKTSLGDQIWASWPTSRYAAYYLPQHRPADDYASNIEICERAILLRPEPIYIQAHRMQMAFLYVNRMDRAIEKHDVAAAIAAAERARSLYSELSREALDPAVRLSSSEQLKGRVPSPKAIVRLIRLLSGETVDLLPFADCVQRRADGGVYVWFGYENANSAEIRLPIGQQNRFTPAPFDRGQPTSFAPDSVHLVFAVKADAPQLTWHLQGETAHARVDAMPPCPAEVLPRP
jgi:hypothetical protein